MVVGIVSDTHGFVGAWDRAYALYLANTDLILHAGDILYCSPGYNAITRDFDPASLADRLNTLSVPIIFCRGDNDADVDQKRLEHPIMSEFVFVHIDGLNILMHHGESEAPIGAFKTRLTPVEMALYSRRMGVDVMVMGRTHRPYLGLTEGMPHINPGSPVATVHDNHEPSVALMDTVSRSVRVVSTADSGRILAEGTLPFRGDGLHDTDQS